MADWVRDPSLSARHLDIPANTPVYEPGSPARNLYFIHSGQVRVYQIGPNGAARLVEILGPGEWFGAASLSSLGSHFTRAIAVSRSGIAEVPVDRLLPLLAAQPDVASELIVQLAGKLQAAHDDAARLVFDDCEDRLIKTLLHFSHTAAASPHQGGEVVLRITHQALAQAVGAARETVSLTLTRLRQQNLLRTGRNRLFFNPQVLQAVERKRGGVRPSEQVAM